MSQKITKLTGKTHHSRDDTQIRRKRPPQIVSDVLFEASRLSRSFIAAMLWLLLRSCFKAMMTYYRWVPGIIDGVAVGQQKTAVCQKLRQVFGKKSLQNLIFGAVKHQLWTPRSGPLVALMVKQSPTFDPLASCEDLLCESAVRGCTVYWTTLKSTATSAPIGFIGSIGFIVLGACCAARSRRNDLRPFCAHSFLALPTLLQPSKRFSSCIPNKQRFWSRTELSGHPQ